MPIKDTLSDGTLYFVDTETGVRSILGGISEVNLITEEEKESSGRFKLGERIVSGDLSKGFSYTAVCSINNFSMGDVYLKCLEDGVDVICVPNNFRRMHGYKVRRRSLRKRRAMQKLKMAWKKEKAQ